MRLADARRLIGGDADGGGHLVFVKTHHLARRDGRADAAEQPGGGEAHVAFRRRRAKDIADAAAQLVAQHHGFDQLLAADPAAHGHRHQRRAHRAGRVDYRLVMRIVERQRGGTQRVHQRGIQRIEFHLRADHHAIRFAVELADGFQHFQAHRLAGAARGAADVIHKSAQALVLHIGGQGIEMGVDGEAGNLAGDVGHVLCIRVLGRLLYNEQKQERCS